MAEIRGVWLHAHKMLRTARQMINENLRPLNLSSAEGNILLHLWTQGQEMGHQEMGHQEMGHQEMGHQEMTHREMRQEQLVEQLDVSKPAVSRTLDSLEAKGFITRAQDPQDGRAHRICMTDKARAIGPAVEQAYNQLYTVAMQGVSEEELAAFMDLFGRIAENFSRANTKNKVEERHAA